jgi:hypothetical protein
MWVKSALAVKINDTNDINVQLYLFNTSSRTVSASIVSQFLSIWMSDSSFVDNGRVFGTILRPEVRTYAYIPPGKQTER